MTIPVPPPAAQTRARRAELVAGLAQVAAFVALLAGVYLLAGVAWALVLGGALVLAASVLAEFVATRPPRPAPATTPGGDR